MRKTSIAFALAALAAGAQAEGIHWKTDLEAAKRIARHSKRKILVDFYADW